MAITIEYPFDDPANYTFDTDLIEVLGGAATLKFIDETGLSFNEDFASDAGFTYDNAKAEFTGGKVQQIDQSPTDAVFGITYTTVLDASWTENNLSLTPTLTSDPVINANRIDLTGNIDKRAVYVNADIGDVFEGAIKFKLTPDYSGSPPVNTTLIVFKPANGSPPPDHAHR